jgi:FtsH-binding integral membrane protein
MNCITEKVIFEAWDLTTVIFINLTLYTLWAARRGQDFSSLGPFLFAALIVLLGFSLIWSSFCNNVLIINFGEFVSMIS